MKIFLLDEIKNLGRRGEIKEVADGYARFLLNQKKACSTSDKKVKEILEENLTKRQEINKLKQVEEEKIKALAGSKIIFKAKADKNGHLYGSIGPKEIAKKLNIPESMIKTNFKVLGQHELTLDMGQFVKVFIVIEKEI